MTNYDSPFPSDFNGSEFLLDPHTYEYLNASFQRNQDPPVNREGEYSTDVLAGKAYGFLDDGIAADNPFFLSIAPIAPHSNVKFEEDWFHDNVSSDAIKTSPPIAAERHKNLFKDVIVPRTPSFNPDQVVITLFIDMHNRRLVVYRLMVWPGFPSCPSRAKRTSTSTTNSIEAVSVPYKR